MASTIKPIKKNKNESWGRTIKRLYGDEGYREYRKIYFRIRRFSKETKINIDWSREAATMFIANITGAVTRIAKTYYYYKEQKQKYRHDKEIDIIGSVEKVYKRTQVEVFANKHMNNLLSDSLARKYKAKTYGDVYSMWLDGKISDTEFTDFMKNFKESTIYILTGSP